MKQELQKELSELKQKVESIEKRIESMPDEKGKWVPEVDDAMFLIDGAGNVEYDEYEPTPYQKKCVARGNCYPTEHAAIEAREQQDNGAPKFSTEQTARHLLADASPELRKAVGELVRGSMYASEERTIKSDWGLSRIWRRV